MMGYTGKTPPALSEMVSKQRAHYSLIGIMRFDASAVANALRSGDLTPLSIEYLAKLIEGTHPMNLRLAIKGQGKGWKPIYEQAKAYERLIAIGEFVDGRVADGCNIEGAVIDAAEAFGLSEPTIYRDLSLYRCKPESD